MSKRLQVVVPDAELQRYERAAAGAGLTLSGWVRQALGTAHRQIASGEIDGKLSAVREAVRHEFPAPEVEAMLDEVRAGYLATTEA